ncbi:unnamed protein product [Euphydryas editha]|uniref:2Fe-2S ferredoxin-type domain-containing protein n=1 Tax=Euphydryas editha TaxID=104508 RepID=A0AAU9UTL4_EUPED|nr:unnamed protein product [Euphydryas editha]
MHHSRKNKKKRNPIVIISILKIRDLESFSTNLGERFWVKVTFHLFDGRKLEAEGKVGDSLLDVVVNNDLDIDGYGACEGTVTCSTCHVVLKQKDFDRLPEEAGDEERDMLDLAYGLTDTSRLGCQVILTKDLDGLEVKVPESVNDARS